MNFFIGFMIVKFSAVIQNKFQAEQFCKRVMEAAERGESMAYDAKELKGDQVRTHKQNNAIHQYCGDLGDALTDAGYDLITFVKTCYKDGVSVPWTVEQAKENIWRPVQVVITGKHSTTKLDTKQVSEVYDAINRHIAEKTGVSVPFPSIDNFIFKSYG